VNRDLVETPLEMNKNFSPSLDEFRACVLAAYAPIMRDKGFVELRGPKDNRRYNEFTVRIGNGVTVIEVAGINYGLAAWTRVFRAADADNDYYGLPIYHLIRKRQGLSDKDLNKLRKKRKSKSDSQLVDIRKHAEDILKHAQDVLIGDFSELDEIVEQERLLAEERLKRQLSPEKKAAAIAASQAGHAFKRNDYKKVLALLEPHLPHLSASQRKQLAIAKKIMENL
jgi:hypothetical protein